jgi:hypothetical protein
MRRLWGLLALGASPSRNRGGTQTDHTSWLFGLALPTPRTRAMASASMKVNTVCIVMDAKGER